MSKELKILYVEDDKENREGLIELLSGDIISHCIYNRLLLNIL